jgi:acetyltransferase (GNAT) family protein
MVIRPMSNGERENLTLDSISISPMTEEFILWRCLHDGPLSKKNIDISTDTSQECFKYKSTSFPLLKKLIRTYGTCAMLAWDNNEVVGFVRFYPKVIESMPEAVNMCLLQDFPNGPSENLVHAEFPPLDKIRDKTLVVNCMMTGSPLLKQNPYQRKGLGSRLVRALIDWATGNGWKAIEATAYTDLPIVFEITGNAGRRWWERLGFQLVSIDEEPAMKDEDEFVKTAERQAIELNMDPNEVKNRYRLRLKLNDSSE